MKKKLHISYYGYFTPMGGYGIANINWVKHLKREGVVVSVHPKFIPQPDSFEWEILSEEEKSMFNYSFTLYKIGVIETNPFDFDTIKTQVRIANTMCESDHVDESWAEKLNSMDHIIVPNDWNRKVFIDSGVIKPITVIPHGVSTESFPYFNRPKRNTFTFGIVGYLDVRDRKGALDVIRAFASEFDNNEPVRLILKSSDPTFGYYSQFKDNRIKVITDKMSFGDINNLYREMDCFVFPSKAEGVGYPPREAMSTGLPTILTNWSGLTDIAFESIAYPLNPKVFKKRPNFIEQNGMWAIPDISELMYKMRYVYEHQKEAKEKGRLASQYIRKHFSWNVCAKKLKVFLLKYENGMD